jgi:hypothetical protein
MSEPSSTGPVAETELILDTLPEDADAAMVSIYVDDPDDLRFYLFLLATLGFVETAFCELTREDSRDVVSYGPCRKLPRGPG